MIALEQLIFKMIGLSGLVLVQRRKAEEAKATSSLDSMVTAIHVRIAHWYIHRVMLVGMVSDDYPELKKVVNLWEESLGYLSLQAHDLISSRSDEMLVRFLEIESDQLRKLFIVLGVEIDSLSISQEEAQKMLWEFHKGPKQHYINDSLNRVEIQSLVPKTVHFLTATAELFSEMAEYVHITNDTQNVAKALITYFSGLREHYPNIDEQSERRQLEGVIASLQKLQQRDIAVQQGEFSA